MKGSYILVLDLAENTQLTIGRLGSFRFPAGLYFYCGSALNGLEARIRRHLRRDKKLHWHIDYLAAVAEVTEVWWVADQERWECRWAEAITGLGGGMVAKGFGSSDCRCPTHLLRVNDGASAEAIRMASLNAETGAEQGIWRAPEEGKLPKPEASGVYIVGPKRGVPLLAQPPFESLPG